MEKDRKIERWEKKGRETERRKRTRARARAKEREIDRRYIKTRKSRVSWGLSLLFSTENEMRNSKRCKPGERWRPPQKIRRNIGNKKE